MAVTTSQITTGSNGNLSLDPNGSGKVRLNPLANSGNQPVGVDNNGDSKKFLVTELNSATAASNSNVMIQTPGGSTVQKSTIGQIVSGSGADKVYTATNAIGYVAGNDKVFEVQINGLTDRGDGGPPPIVGPDPPAGGDPETQWGPVLTMLHQYFDDNPTGAGGGLISNTGFRGLGDNKVLNQLPSNDQYVFGIRNIGSTGVTLELDQGNFSSEDQQLASAPSTIVSRSSSKVSMSRVIDSDTKTRTFTGGQLNQPWSQRFAAAWIFHGAGMLFGGMSGSYHSGHTIIERTGAELEHTFEIPCSNSGSSATAAYIFVIGSGASVDFSYSPPPKYGGAEHLSGYKGPGANPMNWIETAMGFNGAIHVSVKKDSGTPYQLCCCYWKISY